MAQRTLVWVDRAGSEEPLETPVLAYQRPRVSPEGTRVAVDVADPEGADIWIHDYITEPRSRVPSSASATTTAPTTATALRFM